MKIDDIMRMRVCDVEAVFKQRDRFRSALEEIVKHSPAVSKLPLMNTLRSIAVEALEKV
jgi:hypothetical protein